MWSSLCPSSHTSTFILSLLEKSCFFSEVLKINVEHENNRDVSVKEWYIVLHTAVQRDPQVPWWLMDSSSFSHIAFVLYVYSFQFEMF